MTRFLKMHGLGNDFVVFDARKQGFALDRAAARAIADRRKGVGCDQVIVIEKGRDGVDAVMRSINADGGEIEACGNASRCVAQLLIEEMDREEVTIGTQAGPLVCRDAGEGLIAVDMGAPRFGWREIPLAEERETKRFTLRAGGNNHEVSAVSMGNPHCIFFVEDWKTAPVAELGAEVETLPLFPNRTNVEFVQVLAPDRLRMRVWERGAGITSACGTGACAVAAAAQRLGLADAKLSVIADGGTLLIEAREDDHILMTGPATLSFRGDIDLGTLA
ncbi:MAG: diaminopimelate epimerase [Alphaproteobacteria bacterium]|nr:diaminopimelate epimerase [Alphaproteobacteria bacterium]